MSTANPYLKKAQTIFKNITGPTGYFTLSTDYWQVGCVFDTLLDYMRAALEAGIMTKTEAHTFVASVYSQYTAINAEDDGGCWYDDFGWWGIACSKAYDANYADVFGKHAAEFQAISTHCWHVMNDGKSTTNSSGQRLYQGAPEVWKTANTLGYTSLKDCAPRIDGGVWQYDMWPDYRVGACGINPNNPHTAPLGPFQLAVVNGLYMVLALRLQEAGVTVTPKADVFTFFCNWAYNKMAADDKWIRSYSVGQYLVRERVSTYADVATPGTYPPVHNYVATRCWSGDQGLFMGGMVDFMKVHANETGFDKENAIALQTMNSIIDAMFNQMLDATYGLPKTWSDDTTMDPGDYQSGAGIFARYLLYAWEHNANAKSAIKGYKTQIATAAGSCLNDDYQTYYMPPNLFSEFDAIAILLLANAVVPDGSPT